jgi:hypothetical protein
MSDTVWVSNAMNNIRLDRDIACDKSDGDVKALIDTLRRNAAGEPLESALFPTAFFPGASLRGPLTKMPHFFKGGGFWAVDKPVADVLRQFDMGKGGLYPVKIFQKDRTTQVDGEYFCINFGHAKQAFSPEDSSKRIRKVENPTYYKMPFVPDDDEIAQFESALSGPDIWVEPLLINTFFISNKLRSALKKAKLDGAFRLFKCRIVANT